MQVIKSIWCTGIPARANIWCDCRRRAAATGQRNGYDRTELFSEPFRGLTAAGLPAMVLDGEIAVPDERGVTHLDALSEAISGRQPERLAYFAFDLLHLDGLDLRRCPIERYPRTNAQAGSIVRGSSR